MKCEVCKREFKEYELKRIFTGRTHWICEKCYKEGFVQATQRSLDMIEAIKKGYRK